MPTKTRTSIRRYPRPPAPAKNASREVGDEGSVAEIVELGKASHTEDNPGLIEGLIVVGVDPGPLAGVGLLRFGVDGAAVGDGPVVLQCSPELVEWAVRELFALGRVGLPLARGLLAVEKFVVAARAGRSLSPSSGRVTREMVGTLSDLAAPLRVTCLIRTASEILPWATDDRLRTAGLYAPTAGMPHARSALRHALYAAVRDGGVRDPLSRRV